jgi:fluoride ion exporter CrcB/FEX
MVTTALYCVATFAFFPSDVHQEAFFSSMVVGIFAALFFFAVRDVYATSLAVGFCSVFTTAGRISPVYLRDIIPSVWIGAALSASVLVSIHFYFSRNYVTLKIS